MAATATSKQKAAMLLMNLDSATATELLKELGAEEIEQIAVLAFASKQNKQEFAGGKILLVDELLCEIVKKLSKTQINKNAVPEQYPLLRTIQFITHYKNKISEVWGEK